MQAKQPLLTDEQFERLQTTIIAAQMLPYFFDCKKNYTFGKSILQTPYAKSAMAAHLLIKSIDETKQEFLDWG
jgi:hypothetical protein